MFTKIRLILVAAVVGVALAGPGSASAASTPEAKRFHGLEPAAQRFHGTPDGYRWGSLAPNAKRFHGIRIAGGRNGG